MENKTYSLVLPIIMAKKLKEEAQRRHLSFSYLVRSILMFWLNKDNWGYTKSKIEQFRNKIEHDYEKHPTGCGGSFGEILCHEIHESGLTFKWLAKKWGISVAFLGELIADHCRKL